jgi:hypothetical protein
MADDKYMKSLDDLINEDKSKGRYHGKGRGGRDQGKSSF